MGCCSSTPQPAQQPSVLIMTTTTPTPASVNPNHGQGGSQVRNSPAIQLFQSTVAAVPQIPNVFMSPFSVGIALSVLSLGADGDTLRELRSVLAHDQIGDEATVTAANQVLMQAMVGAAGVQFQTANSIWCRADDSDILPAFKQAAQSGYAATAFPLTQAEPINSWCAEHTDGKISHIIDLVTSATVMVIVNAIYFKGTWKTMFDKEATKPGTFHILGGGEPKEVPMMKLTTEFSYLETETLQLVDLEYGEGEFGSIVVLPKPGQDINQLVARLSVDEWAQWMHGRSKKEGTLQLPRMKVEFGTIDLIPALQKMGLNAPFGGSCNLSRLTSEPAVVSNVMHKAVVELNEEGATAAAATAVVVSRCLPAPGNLPFEMKVDRPFLFTIYHRPSETIVFLGRIADPQP
eukprot:NODE_543_length_1560_cov_261.755791_g409_i0.p1 GENE.NODE_543_length_1560_cov_261.755791_g409_i0~~NODE_543_length_1560_cov_261.755791_g409_i0.p1  ORF type:complete len:405 (-),score=88.86 NODE_543_length_1560_cov_261.755791_g409_i0:212-1426(-)